jgi:hypothetical protein
MEQIGKSKRKNNGGSENSPKNSLTIAADPRRVMMSFEIVLEPMEKWEMVQIGEMLLASTSNRRFLFLWEKSAMWGKVLNADGYWLLQRLGFCSYFESVSIPRLESIYKFWNSHNRAKKVHKSFGIWVGTGSVDHLMTQRSEKRYLRWTRCTKF